MKKSTHRLVKWTLYGVTAVGIAFVLAPAEVCVAVVPVISGIKLLIAALAGTTGYAAANIKTK